MSRILRRAAGSAAAAAALGAVVLVGAPSAHATPGHHWSTAGPATSSPDAGNTPLDLAATEDVIGATASWDQGDSGQGIDVAVLDTGVTPVDGLDTPGKIIYGPDLSFDSQTASAAYLDGFGHGTAMAGLIAGDDGTPGGFAGVAPDARIVSVKVGAANGAVDVSQIIAGIDWVTQHAQTNGLNIRVLSLSLGTDSLQPYQIDPLAHAAEVAWRHGIVVVAAAGNLGRGADALDDPASDPYVIAVGASDSNGTQAVSDDVVADFSSIGTGQRPPDLVAPGAYITGLRDPGSSLDDAFPAARVGTRFFRGSGTSQAAALTSGGVADLLSSDPSLTPDQVKALLTNTAQSIGTAPQRAVGNGLLDIAAAETASLPRHAAQNFPVARGTGSLEAARGDSHVTSDGVALTGQQDIFGDLWSAGIASLEEQDAAWNGGTYNGATWSGDGWTAAGWDGGPWSGSSWSGSSWAGSSWAGSSWAGSSWAGSSWAGSSWAGSSWAGDTWSGETWS
jgi:serine protease AprX